MAHHNKQGFLSSLFGKKKQKEEEEAANLELRHRIEERIQQVLAESIEIPKVLMLEEKRAELTIPEAEVEAPVDLFPISASVISSRKAPAQSDFLLSSFKVPRSYAANER
jgi:hypothetical protein